MNNSVQYTLLAKKKYECNMLCSKTNGIVPLLCVHHNDRYKLEVLSPVGKNKELNFKTFV
jgi:hypothetical protein